MSADQMSSVKTSANRTDVCFSVDFTYPLSYINVLSGFCCARVSVCFVTVACVRPPAPILVNGGSRPVRPCLDPPVLDRPYY